MQLRHMSTNLRQGLRRNMSMHAAVVLTLFVSLTLGGIGVLLNRQAELTTQVIGNELKVSVYLCVPDESDRPNCPGEVTAAQEQAIIDTIKTNPEVASYEEISKEQGLANFIRLGLITKEQTEGPDAILTADNVPKELRVTLKDPDRSGGLKSAVEDLDGVRNVVLAKDLVGNVFTVINVIKYSAFGAALVLLLAAVMLVANTIRLTALARRREIEIMRLVGASRIFIVLPFLMEAIFNAVLGVLLAGGALAALTKFGIIDYLDDSFQALPFVGWDDYLYTLVVIGIAGPVLTLVPTLLLTRKYLRF